MSGWDDFSDYKNYFWHSFFFFRKIHILLNLTTPPTLPFWIIHLTTIKYLNSWPLHTLIFISYHSGFLHQSFLHSHFFQSKIRVLVSQRVLFQPLFSERHHPPSHTRVSSNSTLWFTIWIFFIRAIFYESNYIFPIHIQQLGAIEQFDSQHEYFVIQVRFCFQCDSRWQMHRAQIDQFPTLEILLYIVWNSILNFVPHFGFQRSHVCWARKRSENGK